MSELTESPELACACRQYCRATHRYIPRAPTAGELARWIERTVEHAQRHPRKPWADAVIEQAHFLGQPRTRRSA